MKKMLIPALILLFSSVKSFSQEWHAASDTLKYPVYSTHGESTMEYYNRFDTVICAYKIEANNNIFRGYKIVYVFNGYYVDTPNTVNVFFDEKKRRIANVSSYYLN